MGLVGRGMWKNADLGTSSLDADDAADGDGEGAGEGGRAMAVSMALIARAVVSPRLPAFTPVEPNW